MLAQPETLSSHWKKIKVNFLYIKHKTQFRMGLLIKANFKALKKNTGKYFLH
jgi:hypothetical protein